MSSARVRRARPMISRSTPASNFYEPVEWRFKDAKGGAVLRTISSRLRGGAPLSGDGTEAVRHFLHLPPQRLVQRKPYRRSAGRLRWVLPLCAALASALTILIGFEESTYDAQYIVRPFAMGRVATVRDDRRLAMNGRERGDPLRMAERAIVVVVALDREDGAAQAAQVVVDCPSPEFGRKPGLGPGVEDPAGFVAMVSR